MHIQSSLAWRYEPALVLPEQDAALTRTALALLDRQDYQNILEILPMITVLYPDHPLASRPLSLTPWGVAMLTTAFPERPR